MNIQPFGDKIIVKQLLRKTKTESGLILTESITEKPNEGEVIAVGKDVVVDIEVGIIVLYNKFAGNIIEDNNEEYLILREEDLYGRKK